MKSDISSSIIVKDKNMNISSEMITTRKMGKPCCLSSGCPLKLSWMGYLLLRQMFGNYIFLWLYVLHSSLIDSFIVSLLVHLFILSSFFFVDLMSEFVGSFLRLSIPSFVRWIVLQFVRSFDSLLISYHSLRSCEFCIFQLLLVFFLFTVLLNAYCCFVVGPLSLI